MSDGTNLPDLRDFDYERDLDAVKRIWREVGWVEEAPQIAALDHFFRGGHTQVGTIDDVAECSVHVVPGTQRLHHTDLPLCAVTAVTTSRIARGRAFAQRLTARQLAWGQAQGAVVAALGMFDQGFYDKLGFGTGAYDYEFTFDPGLLRVDPRVPTPVRFTSADARELHQAMQARMLGHGAVCLHSVDVFRAELDFTEHGFGLGYRDADGGVSHFLWLEPSGERGPYRVNMCAYTNTDQLLELLGLLKSLADQVYSVKLMEPPEIQLQSLLERPMRHMQLTRGGKHHNEIRALAWWQSRVLDVSACVSALGACADTVAFNLTVSDPLEGLLPADSAWRGVGGDYTVELGDTCRAIPGHRDGLLQVSCTVNTLTRLLWGVRNASSLAVSDGLSAPAALLEQLDAAIRLPAPVTGWDF